MQARIFNIQRFSLHDGPGVRTTVFFKGCPLRCAWCANPESIAPGTQVLRAEKSCTGCGVCASTCPESAVTLSGSEAAPIIDHARCSGCGRCVEACPAKALSLSGSLYSLDEALAVCLRDREFYEDSGGGVTLSGGEATAQPAFACALMGELRRRGVHTALETNGFAGEAVFRETAACAELLLFDVKHHDSERHRAGTGVDNLRILANLGWALASGKNVLVRIPVIRGYNDSLEDARAFTRLLLGMGGMGAGRVQLLPFHQMGESKYASLGISYPFRDVPPLRKEALEEFRSVLLAGGLEAIL